MMSETVVITLLGSSVLVALITLVSNVVTFKMNRKAAKEDKELSDKDELKEINKKLDDVVNDQAALTKKVDDLSVGISNLTEGSMMLLKKEIERQAVKCISSGKIKIKTREEIHTMHSIYHNKLNGNGGLKSVMEDIDNLPLDTADQ